MKKHFLLFTAIMVALQVMAAGGTASDPYLNITKYATIDEAGANVDGMESIYKYTQQGTGYWLTVSNYGVMMTDATQNWFVNEIDDSDTGSQYTTAWTATDIFQGPSAYFGDNSAYSAKYKMPTKTQTFYVTFCTQVKQYAYHRSNASYYLFKMDIYECTKNEDGSITDGTTPIESLTNSVIGTEVLTSSELDPEKVYKVVLSNSYSYLYEIGFKTPGEFDGDITAPVAYEATNVEVEHVTMSWSPCLGAKSYTVRTYPCQLEGLIYRETFENFSADNTIEDWQSLDAYTDHPEWQGFGLSAADGGIVIENSGMLMSPMSNENAVYIPKYQRKYTFKFKAKPAPGVTDGQLLVTIGGNSQTFDVTGPEKYYTMVIERGLNGSYDYMSTNYACFTMQNTYYHNPYDETEEEDHRVVLTDFKAYYGDYSEGAGSKYVTVSWIGDSTIVSNITDTTFSFGTGQTDISHYNGDGYWIYDVKAVYYDGQESDWSNKIYYSTAPWPVFLEDDDDPGQSVPGDVNGDGQVTAADITALYNFILTGDDSDIVNGDQTGDGEITSADVTEVYNILLFAK
ncbi:MAG: dockerin type I repeat-containing protein [Muribaculaceae bacterium]|nr:dockerin type I repeat-containing protein [Muribaculaceae bacterium]